MRMFAALNAKQSHAAWEARIALLLVLFVALFALANSGTQCARADASCQVAATASFASAITVNEDGNDADSRFEGDTQVNLLYLDAGNDRVGIGSASPSSVLDVSGVTTTITLSVSSGFTGAAFLDEDNLASDSDTKVASQQSIKAYVDTEVAAVDSPVFLDKTGDETVNNNTLQDDNDLTFAVLASKNYAVWGNILANSGAVPDIKFSWSVPAGATADFRVNDNTTNNVIAWTEAGDHTQDGLGANDQMNFMGTIVVAGTAGTVVIQWAQSTTDASDTKVLEGSWMAFRLLN